MRKEIEHKFLVRPELLPRPLPRGERFCQGYLSVRPTVRVRLATNGRNATAFLTIKGAGLRSRDEYEYAIPASDARRLLKLCSGKVITKIRRRLGGWEVDEFLSPHRGLWLAEYELRSTRARLPKLPPWIGREVTGDGRFSNASLALNPDSPL